MRSPAAVPARAARSAQRGFTLIELMVVVGIAAVCFATAVALSPQVIRTAKADSGSGQALDALRAAREMAISQRRNIQVQFVGTNQIEILRVNIPNGDTTLIRTVHLENRMRFMLVPGVPDTPDLFGRTAAASFPSATRLFTSEGTFVNAAGDPMNGTLFLAVPDVPNTARAITFFGPTALLRSWRWDGSKWVE